MEVIRDTEKERERKRESVLGGTHTTSREQESAHLHTEDSKDRSLKDSKDAILNVSAALQ